MIRSRQMLSGIFLLKIIKIGQCLTKLQLMINGMLFLTHGVLYSNTVYDKIET